MIPFFPNVDVTDGSSPFDWQVEPTMAINRSGTIFVGWKETFSADAAGQRVGASYSTDQGRTWAANILMNQSHPDQGRCNSDPWMALGPDDRVQYAYLEYVCSQSPPAGLNIANTTDGQSWSNVQYRAGAGGLTDKDSIWVDSSGRIYAAWDEGNVIDVTWSDDGGANWRLPFVHPDDFPGGVLGAIIATNATGTVYVCWWDFGSDDILFDWSSDGVAWHADVVVNDVPGSAIGTGWQLAIPAMNVDQTTGAIYIAWPDSRNGDQDIFVSASTDGGQTWSENQQINDDAGSTTQYMVDLAIDSQGTVHAAWEDKRNSAWNIFYSNSTDGGQTWSSNLRVSSVDTPGSYDRPGDYFAIEAGPGDYVYVVWTDGRGSDFDIYYARNPGFEAATITLATSPTGLPVTVDGVTVTAPVQENWTIGSSHNISVASTIPINATAKYLWTSWSDGGTISHTIVADSDRTITAAFKKQYQAKVAPDPDGLIVRVDNVSYTAMATFWWDEGTSHWVQAPSPQSVNADSRYVWSSWSDGGAAAHSVIANPVLSIKAVFVEEQAMRISTSPDGPAFSVDGAVYSTASTFWFEPGSYHILSVATLQSGSPGTRYQFAAWSDGGSATHVVQFTAATSIQATFSTEYYLTVTSPVPGASGSGWYADGSQVSAIVTNDIYAQGPGERLTFQGWSGDATGNGLASDPVVMDGPKAAIAQYGTQYYLEVSSGFASASGAGWYDAGTTAVASLASGIVAVSAGTRAVFVSWTGDGTGTDPAASSVILMDRPRAVDTIWRIEYELRIDTAHGTAVGAGWYPAGSYGTAGLNASIIDTGPGQRVVFAGWTGDAVGNSASGSNPILMSGPRTASTRWSTEYLLRVDSDVGSVEGSGWYPSGASVSLDAPAQMTAGGQTYEFAGWTGASTSKDPSITLIVNAPTTVRATWSAVGTLGGISAGGWGLIVAIGIALLVVLLLARRRRK